MSTILYKPIRSSGLIIDNKLPILATSPDGLINEDSPEEIKWPISPKNISPEDVFSKTKIKKLRYNKWKVSTKTNGFLLLSGTGATLHLEKKSFASFVFEGIDFRA